MSLSLSVIRPINGGRLDRSCPGVLAVIYGSVFSGIEAATVAWHRLGWQPAFLSEIDPFCCALLGHHYPEVVNLGDIDSYKRWPDATVDLIVGGSPCQDFSVAGRREGLGGERGRLTLVYLEVLRRFKPRWVVWENVPGVLSSHGGRDFGAFLGELGQLGYGWAYRVLDAQYVRVESHARAVPQRRRRVILVGYLGDIRPAAAVLFEPACLLGDPPPRRETRQAITGTLSSRPRGSGGLGTDFDLDGGVIGASHALCASRGGVDREDRHTLIARAFGGGCTSGSIDAAATLSAGGACGGRMDFETETFVAHCLKAEGADASEDGTGRGVPLVAFDTTQITSQTNRCNPQPGDPCHPLAAGAHAPAIAFNLRGREHGSQPEPSDVASMRAANGGSSRSYVAHSVCLGSDPINSEERAQPLTCRRGDPGTVSYVSGVRRLTPRECERLQGFPDDYTLIPYRGKSAADGPRYKALGNSMAINVMSWVGERIRLVNGLLRSARNEAVLPAEPVRQAKAAGTE